MFSPEETWRVPSSEDQTTPQPTKRHHCHHCRYTTNRRNNLQRHIQAMHSRTITPLRCCDVDFPNKASLRQHTHACHRDGYQCRECGRIFCRKALLRRHHSVHTGIREHVCDLCDYATSHKSNLERHRKIHERNFQSPENMTNMANDSKDAAANLVDDSRPVAEDRVPVVHKPVPRRPLGFFPKENDLGGAGEKLFDIKRNETWGNSPLFNRSPTLRLEPLQTPLTYPTPRHPFHLISSWLNCPLCNFSADVCRRTCTQSMPLLPPFPSTFFPQEKLRVTSESLLSHLSGATPLPRDGTRTPPVTGMHFVKTNSKLPLKKREFSYSC